MTKPPEPPYPMRLQKFLARAGVASRRGSENLMCAGRVSVNGQVITELGSKVDPKCDTVCVDGVPVELSCGTVSIILNKPAGYLTTMRDPQGRPCVATLVPTERYPGLFPVGRLDKDTTGLLLFTTDGQLAQRLLHPSHHAHKRYLALVEGKVTEKNLQQLRRGILLDDGWTAPAKARLFSAARALKTPLVSDSAELKGRSLVELEIYEGRKHQVKRMLKATGHPVVRLHRDRFATLTLDGVEPGRWRILTPQESATLSQTSSNQGLHAPTNSKEDV